MAALTSVKLLVAIYGVLENTHTYVYYIYVYLFAKIFILMEGKMKRESDKCLHL